jgi:hypothetical protein
MVKSGFATGKNRRSNRSVVKDSASPSTTKTPTSKPNSPNKSTEQSNVEEQRVDEEPLQANTEVIRQRPGLQDLPIEILGSILESSWEDATDPILKRRWTQWARLIQKSGNLPAAIDYFPDKAERDELREILRSGFDKVTLMYGK